MPIVYKTDALKALKDAGYSSYRIRKENIIGQRQLQQLRDGVIVSSELLSRICRLTGLQPGDIMEYRPDTEQ